LKKKFFKKKKKKKMEMEIKKNKVKNNYIKLHNVTFSIWLYLILLSKLGNQQQYS